MTEILVLEDLSETRRWLVQVAQTAFSECKVTEATNVRAGMVCAAAQKFDIALLDLGLPDGSGIDVLRRIRSTHPDTLCIMTTVMGDDASIVSALSAGADGYLLKEQSSDLIVRQLTQAAHGIPALSPSVARRIMEHFKRTGPVEEDGALTIRERDVLALVGKGLRNAEVASALKLSEHTVAGHIKNIYRKLGISSRAEASWHAARMGLQ